ncbi:MAG: SUMF1/EgtB/PvdO family nonheme iron enzyme [Opitutales bacterium]
MAVTPTSDPTPEAPAPPPENGGAGESSATQERRSRDIHTTPPFAGPLPGRAYEVLTAGERLGPYQIHSCLSYDLLGSLYQIERPRNREENPPSLFMLPPMVEHDKAFRKRFKTDARRLCDIDHENILSYNEAAEIDGRLCFKLDHFEGENLIDYLESVSADQDTGLLPGNDGETLPDLMADRSVGLPPDEVRAILTQLATAVDYAHRRGFRHLSLNPTNMLRGSDGRVKVLGFGLLDITGAKLFDELASAGIPPISIGKVRMRVNTVDILSPEVRLGQQGDNRSDIYALGITTYWLLTGRKPASQYMPPSTVNPSIPECWDALVANCLERDPDKRYQSAAALLRDLEKLEEIGQHGALDPGTAETRSVFRHIDFIPVPKALERRSRTAARLLRLGILGLVGAGLVGGAQFFTVGLFQPEPPAPAPAIRKPGVDVIANVRFQIEPQVAQLVFPDTGDSFLLRDGRLSLYVKPGQHRVRVVANGYRDYEQTHTVGEDLQGLPIALQPDWGRLVLRGLPGTEVIATPESGGDPVPLGAMNAEGELLAEEMLPNGTYTLSFAKTDYQTTTIEDIELPAGETVRAEVRLVPLGASLRVVTEPTGAAVSANGSVLGTTPVTLEDLPALESLELTIAKAGFRSVTLAVRPQPNSQETLQLPPLEALRGSIQPTVLLAGAAPTSVQAAGIRLEVIGESTQAGDDGVFAGLNYGTYTLQASHPDYFPARAQAIVRSEDAAASARFDLEPRPARLTVKPREDVPFQIQQGEAVLKPQADGTFLLRPQAEHRLVFQARDYFPVEHSLQPGPNESVEWTVDLRALPGPKTGESYTVPYLQLPLVWLKPGQVTVGTPLREHARLPTEGPETRATFSNGLWIGATEVTQRAWLEVMGEIPTRYRHPDKPVANISWKDAQAFCAKLTEMETRAGRLPQGYAYRLPTEAEWEYAARGRADGSNVQPFHFGNEASSENGRFMGLYPRDYARHVESPEEPGPKPVGQYPANGFGLFDVHGNVAEWCLDYYGSRLPGGEVVDYRGPATGSKRVVRGGGWRDDAAECRLGARGDGSGPTTTDENIGFRVVLARVR